jgi:hypothetical protein
MGAMVGSLIDHAAATKPLPQHRLKLAEDWGESELRLPNKTYANLLIIQT